MIGSIIGDIVGSIYEFRNINTKVFPFWGNGINYTDDSILTIATANWILQGGKIEEHYVNFGHQYPYPMGGYGGGFERWLFTPSKLCNYEVEGLVPSARQVRHPYNSCGNGSAMRVGPVGWAFDTEREVLEAAKVTAECTHNHPEGIKGAQATALCILLARMKVPQSNIKETIQKRFGYNLSYTVEELRFRYSWDGMDGKGNGGTCQDSVPQAIICALDAISFEDAIRNAISIGGDSDTIGCITGSIAEAIYGIPQQMRDMALTYLPKFLADVVISFENKYSNKAEIANSMKFQECYHCRRANSLVCRNCQNAICFLMNDSRKFFYKNSENESPRGPVKAYLLPYKDVWPDSYVSVDGMKEWDFAGNILDRRTLAVNFNYCPCCNGEFESKIIYPDDRETIYKCKDCGFEFSFGATRMCSEAQVKFSMSFYENKVVETKFIPGMEPFGTSVSCDELNRNRNLKRNERKSVCLPIGTEVVNAKDTYIITGIKEVDVAYIIYNAECHLPITCHGQNKRYFNVELVEQFLPSKDLRGADGKQRIRSGHIIDGVLEQDFYSFLQEKTHLPLKQIQDLLREENDKDFFCTNGTTYFVLHKKGNTKLRLKSQIIYNNTTYEVDSVLGQGSFGKVFRMKRMKSPVYKAFADFFHKRNNTPMFIAVKQLCFDTIISGIETQKFISNEMFRDGYQTLSVLHHPNIVKAFTYEESSDAPYYIMEYIDGCTLYDYINKNGTMTLKQAKRTILSICKTIEYCHDQSQSHGDIKPDNIMMDKRGNIKLIDFSEDVCPDICGIGSVYYFLLTGKYINRNDLAMSLQQVMSEIMRELKSRDIAQTVISHVTAMLEVQTLMDSKLQLRDIVYSIEHDRFLDSHGFSVPNDWVLKHFPNFENILSTSSSIEYHTFCKNGQYGVQENNNRIVIPPIYDYISNIRVIHVPGPCIGYTTVGFETQRGDLRGWYEIKDDFSINFICELSSEQYLRLSMAT